MKVERVSYDVMTPSAARGILEAIYWHPGLRWQIDRIYVRAPIRFTNIRRNEVKDKLNSRKARTVMEQGRGELYLATSESIQQRAAMVLRLVPSGLPLLGMLFFGNLLKESGVTRRLANTASGPLIDTITILLGLTVGASTQASEFLTFDSIKIFALGALSFIIATASGVLFVKLFNLFLKKDNKINPLIGNAGVSAVPDSARISQVIGLEYDPTNYLLMHAMGPNVAGVIGSAVAAGILLGFLM